MNDAVVARLDKVIQLLSKLPSSGAEPQRKKLSDDGKEQFAEAKPKEPREVVKKAIPVQIESYSNESKKFWNDLYSKASSTKTDKAVAEKKEDGGSFFGKLLKILGGIAIGAVLLKFLFPFIKDKVFPFLIDMFKTVTEFITKHITPLLGPALQGIVNFLTKTLPDVVGKFFKSAVDFFKGVWKSITDNWPKWKENILKIWDGLVDFFKGLWDSIRENWYMIWEPELRALWNDTLVPFFEKIWKSIKDTWKDDIEPVLKEFWKGTLVPFFCRIWKSIKDTWKDDIQPALATFWKNTVVPFFERIWREYVIEPIQNAFAKKKLQFEAMVWNVVIIFIESLENLSKSFLRMLTPKIFYKLLNIGDPKPGEAATPKEIYEGRSIEADKNIKRQTDILTAQELAPKLIPSPQPTDTVVKDFISRPGQPTQRFDSTDDVLGYKSDGPINLISKESLALQKTSVTQNTRIIELLVGTNKLLVELGCSAMQKTGNTTIVNAPKTTSLSYSTSPLQSLFRQGVR